MIGSTSTDTQLDAEEQRKVWNLISQVLRKDTHLFERNGNWIFFGKYSGYLTTISEAEMNFLSKFIDDADPYTLIKNNINTYAKKQFILSLVKSIKSKKILQQEPNLPNSIQLTLSDACNMRCSYCYGEYHNTRLHNKLMSVPIALKAVDFAAFIGASNIGFFGGEPLLNFATIKAVVEYAASRGYNFRYGITTNGTLITPTIAKYFSENNIQVSVSIDGTAKNHDTTRRYKNGKSSHSDVISGVKILKKYGCLDMLEMTYSNKHSLNLKPMLEYLAEHCSTISCTCVEGKRDTCFGDEIVRGNRLRKYYQDMFDFVIEKKTEGLNVAVGGINELISGLLSEFTIAKKYLCSTILDRVSISVDGTVYPCPETMSKEFAIINVSEPYSSEEFKTKQACVLDKLTNSSLKAYWFSNLTDVCVARVSWNDNNDCTIEDEESIGMAIEDVLYRVATL